MSSNAKGKSSEVRPMLRNLKRSKTINVAQLANNGKCSNEVSFYDETSRERSATPPAQPTSSCQALRHAVSALTRIDDFLLEELGDGFFANVYKATHKVSGEEMVMKINKDSANRASALREVQLMNRLSHPNILRFLGVCVHEGQLHALTEYVNGGTLETLLSNKEEELPWTLRIKLAVDMSKGIHYLHNEGVFHRDLTSKNILINKKENKNYIAIIADFGLATKIPDKNAREPLPPVGCPWWMAPEMIHGNFYDERADIFSFGIILLEITTRLDADPESMPRTQKFGVDYVQLCDMVDYCPLDFLQFAFKCCQILPEKRPLTNEVMETLERIYRNLKNDFSKKSGFHKRSRSEDNIIQTSESMMLKCYEEEVLVTAQLMAQAMRKEDPLYTPASDNPFASIGRLKDGHKLLEAPRKRKLSGASSGGSCGITSGADGLGSRFRSRTVSTCDNYEEYESQSLPSSPLMLRRAAEKLHQGALHGIQTAVDPDECGPEFGLVLKSSGIVGTGSGHSLEGVGDAAVEARRARFSAGRTRSLGSLDFQTPPSKNRLSAGSLQTQKRALEKMGQNIDRPGFCNRVSSDIRESSLENILEPLSSSPEVFSSSCLSEESNEHLEKVEDTDIDVDGNDKREYDSACVSFYSVAESQLSGDFSSPSLNNKQYKSFENSSLNNNKNNNNSDILSFPVVIDNVGCVKECADRVLRYETKMAGSTEMDARSASSSSLSSYLSCSEMGEDGDASWSPLYSPYRSSTPPSGVGDNKSQLSVILTSTQPSVTLNSTYPPVTLNSADPSVTLNSTHPLMSLTLAQPSATLTSMHRGLPPLLPFGCHQSHPLPASSCPVVVAPHTAQFIAVENVNHGNAGSLMFAASQEVNMESGDIVEGSSSPQKVGNVNTGGKTFSASEEVIMKSCDIADTVKKSSSLVGDTLVSCGDVPVIAEESGSFQQDHFG